MALGTHPHHDIADSGREGRVAATVRAAAHGDQQAWEALVREFNVVVVGVARAHGLRDADVADVTQTTWLRLVEHLCRLHEPGRVGAWLATTARRESLRVRGRASRHVLTVQVPEEGASADPAQLLETREREAAVRRAFRRLRSSDRALLGLLVADPSPSYAQIGRLLRMPVGSIGPTRARSLGRLRREAAHAGLAPEPSEPPVAVA